MNPYARHFPALPPGLPSLQLDFASLADGEEPDPAPALGVAGRVVAKRVMGKLAFLTIRDEDATVQGRSNRNALYRDRQKLKMPRNGEAGLPHHPQRRCYRSGTLEQYCTVQGSVHRRGMRQQYSLYWTGISTTWKAYRQGRSLYRPRQRCVTLSVCPSLPSLLCAISSLVSALLRGRPDGGGFPGVLCVPQGRGRGRRGHRGGAGGIKRTERGWVYHALGMAHCKLSWGRRGHQAHGARWGPRGTLLGVPCTC